MAGAFLISAAGGIVERLLSQAKDLISNKINDQINLACSFTPDLEDLSQTLEIIHALLHDADQNRKKTPATMLVWLKNLKAVVCDAEDLLDELAYEALRRKIEVGFNMRKVTKGNVTIKPWDLVGQRRFRGTWERYFRGVSTILYVVDVADRDSVPISLSELHELLTKTSLSGIPLLVLSNKIAKSKAISKQALMDQLIGQGLLFSLIFLEIQTDCQSFWKEALPAFS
ncbi:hypothetical protein Vadar_011818 [Vaccinium darrowii]|uniref:Uncharacterized protein n=1 Tax=Vaccinium darrowii TaxID=229202 RepID=A0ACB7Z4R3_9ERIC|nr:hypothetical protein Vadar_011818 [Vaccinium darrowii]